jgi:hypothetical protein
MADAQKDLFKLHKDKQEKYIYYLIALAVAALGFSISKTFDTTLKWTQIPWLNRVDSLNDKYTQLGH